VCDSLLSVLSIIIANTCRSDCAPNNFVDVKDAANTKIHLDWKTGVAATNWDEIAKKENLDLMATELRKLEQTVKDIHDEMLYLRRREEEMRNLNGAATSTKAPYF
jgi:p24 family protein delta-1